MASNFQRIARLIIQSSKAFTRIAYRYHFQRVWKGTLGKRQVIVKVKVKGNSQGQGKGKSQGQNLKPETVSEDVWRDWLRVRKKPVTQTVMKRD